MCCGIRPKMSESKLGATTLEHKAFKPKLWKCVKNLYDIYIYLYMIYIYIYHSHANQSNVLNPINLQLGIVWIPPTSGKSSAMCSWNWLYHMNPDLKSVSISSYQSVSPIMWPSTNTYHILIHRNMDDISYYPWTSTIPSEKLARSW